MQGQERRKGRRMPSERSVGVPRSFESRRSYKGSLLTFCCYRCFSNAVPRCTPSSPYPITTLTLSSILIYQKMPKDNPDTRFPIPMLQNDTSAQHHRSSFMNLGGLDAESAHGVVSGRKRRVCQENIVISNM